MIMLFIAGRNETTYYNTPYYYASSNQFHPAYIATTNHISNTGIFNDDVIILYLKYLFKN